MPRGPQGRQRPRDVVGAAVARIAAGEQDEQLEVRTAGQILGQKGGQARARKLTPTQRQIIARQGAETR